jgi:cold shock CspA family protein
MVDDLFSGRVTSFRREQGFGVITLDDGRDVKFDASDCTMVPEEGAAVRLRIGPARWGGGIKALHVEPRGSSTLFVQSPLTLDEQIAALQSEHLVSALSEHTMAQLAITVFGGRIGEAPLIDVLDAFYAADPARAQHDGYVRFVQPRPTASEAHAALAAVIADIELPAPDGHTADDLLLQVNEALETARDARRVFRLAAGPGLRAYFILPADRAKRLSKILPFA